jgi:hypothetical protein
MTVALTVEPTGAGSPPSSAASSPTQPLADSEWSVEQVVAQTRKIQQCIEAVMKENEHFGVIPGTGGRKDANGREVPPKPTLLKAGAEKLCLMFRFDPEYDIVRSVETTELVAFTIRCTLTHIPTGARIASGLGSCNSREAKYTRPAPKRCPKCNADALIVGKPEFEKDEAYKGGWICFVKKGGCGAKYKPNDAAITGQTGGIADPSDLHNTILKMGCKRALIAAVLNGTAASDFFTQDLEDLPGAPAAPAAAAPVAAQPVPRANTVKHDGTFAEGWQVRKLKAIAGSVGGLTEHQRKIDLAAFKDCDGKPIADPANLSEAQIGVLLARYENQIKKQAARAAEQPDMGAVGGVVDVQGKISAAGVDSIRGSIRQKGMDAMAENDLCAIFGIDSIADLPDEQAGAALALVLAYGTAQYDRVLADVQSRY